jgi:hypothetical protein
MATLIGDLVASKRHVNRRGLQRSLTAALDTMNTWLRPSQPLELTVGDEFQGGFSSVAGAARASLMVRLELERTSGTDSRYGLGYGAVSVFDAARAPASQDGPGWWSARSAIERVERLASIPRTSFARTCFRVWPEDDIGPWRIQAPAVDAFLLSRDALVDRMKPRARRLLLGLLLGRAQADMAADERITQSAVSQSLRRSGGFAIEAAHLALEEAPE